ncbi:hypothetical protein P4S68_08090 [Pseudoalteromonas sp. Hal099]
MSNGSYGFQLIILAGKKCLVFLQRRRLGVSGLINQQRGRVQLFGENGTLITGDSFSKNIDYNQINIDLDLAKTDNYWNISSNNIWFDNNEVTLAAELNVSLSDDPRLDLYAEAYAEDATVAGNYFP